MARETRELQKLLGQQIERFISTCSDPAGAMDEIALEAERRGLIHSTTDIRRDDSWVFVMDLWLENPVILDRLNLHRETFSHSKELKDLADVLDVLP